MREVSMIWHGLCSSREIFFVENQIVVQLGCPQVVE